MGSFRDIICIGQHSLEPRPADRYSKILLLKSRNYWFCTCGTIWQLIEKFIGLFSEFTHLLINNQHIISPVLLTKTADVVSAIQILL